MLLILEREDTAHIYKIELETAIHLYTYVYGLLSQMMACSCVAIIFIVYQCHK